MTARPAIRSLTALAGVALLVAACGGSSPSGAPTDAPTAAPTAAPTIAPTTAATQPAASDGLPLPSFHGDVDLEALFPDSIGGAPVTVQSMTGDQFMGSSPSPEMTQMLTLLGKAPKDLSVAFGFTTAAGIIAFQVDGVPGNQILEALKSASKTAAGATITPMSYGGKAVQKFAPADPDEGTSYIYLYQDVVFLVTGSAITDATLNDVFSKLP